MQTLVWLMQLPVEMCVLIRTLSLISMLILMNLFINESKSM